MLNRDFSDVVAAKPSVKEREYWLNKLGDRPAKSIIVYDHHKPVGAADQGQTWCQAETETFRLTGPLFSRLKWITNESDARLHMILVAGVTLLTHFYTGNTDILLGTPIYRQNVEGDFINTVLVLRNGAGSHMTFKELLFQVKETISEAIQHQNYPIKVLLYDLNIPFSAWDFPLFDIVVLLENIQDKSYLKSITPNILFSFYREEDHIRGMIEYNGSLYERATIRGVLAHFKQILGEVLFHVDEPLSGIEMLSAEERRLLLVDFNSTAAEYPDQHTIHGLFARQVERTPHHPAVVGANCTEPVSYHDLNERANQLARALRGKGVNSGTIVALLMERSLEMIISVLAVMKAGGAYLPVDPLYPPDRKVYMLRNSGVRLLLKGQAVHDDEDLAVETLDVTCSQPFGGDPGEPGTFNYSGQALDPAYIIYTSGTTGKPKGVVVEHRSAVNTLLYRKEIYKLDTDTIVLQLFSYSFDGFVTSFFTPVISGAEVVLLSEEEARDISMIRAAIVRHKVNHFISIPGLYKGIIETLTPAEAGLLRVVTLAGESLPPAIFEITLEKNANIEIVNEYGVTEAAVLSTLYRHQEKDSRVKIGRPIWNTKIYILNHRGQLQGIGIPGELCIAGVGVTRGYLNNPELTAEKFDQDLWDYQDYRDEKENYKLQNTNYKKITNDKLQITKKPAHQLHEKNNKKFLQGGPGGAVFSKSAPLGRRRQKIYKTGDIARWLPDGNIIMSGRIDSQVKIRGFRIELGEIESRLSAHENIKEAVVTCKKDGGHEYLCAYVVPQAGPGAELDMAELRDYLSGKLPAYMVPTYFCSIERVPLTPTGKIDRNTLPLPEITESVSYVAPRNPAEETLVTIWAGVLGIEREKIGIDANYFELGGHSLNATLLLLKIHEILDAKVSLAELFGFPTIREISTLIEKAGKERFVSIPAVEQKEYYPLSAAQKRLYILNQLAPGSVNYNVFLKLILVGALCREKFIDAFIRLIDRHESMKTSFHLVENQPVQRVHEEVAFKVEYHEVNSTAGSAEGETGQAVSFIKEFVRPFDLARAPLLRVGLIKQEEEKYLLVMDMHHIITDGLSLGIFARDFMTLYEGVEPGPLQVQYKDFSLWQCREKEKGTFKKQEDFWLQQYKGDIPVLELPLDYPRPAVQRFEGDMMRFRLDEGTVAGLKNLALRENATLFMVLLGIFNILLWKLSGQDEIIVGTPVLGRPHAQLESTIGMFANTLALKNHLSGQKTVGEFLQEVKILTLAALQNQDYPFEELVDQVVLNRDVSRNPLFDVVFDYGSQDDFGGIANLEIPGLKLISPGSEINTSKFDLTLMCLEAQTNLLFTFEYSTNLFKKTTIQRLIHYFKELVSTILVQAHTRKQLSEIEIIPESERKQLLEAFNFTGSSFPRDKVVHQLFEEQAARTPDCIGVCFEGRQLTYRALVRSSNRLANYLVARSEIKKGDLVGMLMERSPDAVIAMLAVLKAGGGYVPIEPDYPSDRIRFTLDDSVVKVLLVDHASSIELHGLGAYPVISLEEVGQEGALENRTCQPADAAYVIYTSGSTGKPKGVMVEHRQVVRLFFAENSSYDFNNRDTWTMFHSYCFDFSVWEIFGALLSGGKLVIIPKPVARDTPAYLEYLKKETVTILNQTPTAFYHLSREEMKYPGKDLCLRYVIFGGEALHPLKLSDWHARYPRTRLINMFGITETTVHVTFKEITTREINQNTSNIGKPIPTLSTLILDKHLKLSPPLTVGELLVGGAGVSRGYLNRPELTAEKFIRDPYRHGERVYRSGDRVRLLESGDMEYRGRSDHQVQVRGFRVEPGEIEARLLKQEEIKEAVVLPGEEDTGTFLCAYIVTGENPDVSRIRKKLSKDLPDYMIPAYFVQLDKIPLTINGKIDRQKLPHPGHAETGQDYIAPRDAVETKLVDIYSGVLGVEGSRIGINHDFFALGGHSLKATIMIANIHQELNVKVPLIEVFKKPTIRELAGYIKETARVGHDSIRAIEKKEFYALSPAQRQIYIMQLMELESILYNMPLFISWDEKSDRGKLADTFKKLVCRHESLRTSFEIIAGKPVQKIHDEVEFEIEWHHSSSIEKPDHPFIRPFDLSRAPLLRVGLVKTGNKQVLMVDMHHIISDGISQGVLANDFMSLYSGKALPPLRLHYKDYSQWQEKRQENGVLMQQEAYWLKQFPVDTGIPRLNLPLDYPRPPEENFEGNNLRFTLSPGDSQALYALAQQEGVTLYMLLLAVSNVFLAKLCARTDIIIGTPVANRRHTDLAQIIGMFVNTLALRSQPGAQKSFKEFLNEIKENILEAFENQDYPFENLVEKVVINREGGRNPIFDFLFELREAPRLDPTDIQFKYQGLEYENRVARFDITLSALTSGQHLEFEIEYKTRLFALETIQWMSRYLINIMKTVIAQPGIKIGEIQMISDQEKNRLLNTIAVENREAEISLQDKKKNIDAPFNF